MSGLPAARMPQKRGKQEQMIDAGRKTQDARGWFSVGVLAMVFCTLQAVLAAIVFAAPCYGTKMPEKKEFFAGVQHYAIFERDLEQGQGDIRSTQDFLLFSYGMWDWLVIDLKGGAGNIKQHPIGSDEIDYDSSFAGGYGFRVRLWDFKSVKAVFGFQHISVHPRSSYSAGRRNRAILDDWQMSLSASSTLWGVTPYLGTRWSRVDYIHWIEDNRKRSMSDAGRSYGCIAGIDIPLSKKMWINLEGEFIDTEAVAVSVNTRF